MGFIVYFYVSKLAVQPNAMCTDIALECINTSAVCISQVLYVQGCQLLLEARRGELLQEPHSWALQGRQQMLVCPS
jgi:hypothetical protein